MCVLRIWIDTQTKKRIELLMNLKLCLVDTNKSTGVTALEKRAKEIASILWPIAHDLVFFGGLVLRVSFFVRHGIDGQKTSSGWFMDEGKFNPTLLGG